MSMSPLQDTEEIEMESFWTEMTTLKHRIIPAHQDLNGNNLSSIIVFFLLTDVKLKGDAKLILSIRT